MNKIYSILLLVFFSAMILSSCKDKDDVIITPAKEELKTLTIEVDKKGVIVGGTVTFKVTSEGKDITTETKIHVDKKEIKGYTFKAEKAGEYKVFASAEGHKNSEEISVIFIDKPIEEKTLTIEASKKEIFIGETVTFKVTVDGQAITTEPKIHIDGKVIEGNTFKAEKEGKYKVYASAEGFKNSEEISIVVVANGDEPRFVLKADKKEAKPGETVTFTVFEYGVDVTSKFRFVLNDFKLPSNTYTIRNTDKGYVSVRAINLENENLVVGVVNVYIDKGETSDKNYVIYATEQAERVLESMRLMIYGKMDDKTAGLFKIKRGGKEYECTKWELDWKTKNYGPAERLSVIFYVPVKTEGGKKVFQAPADAEELFLERVHANLNDKDNSHLPVGNSTADEMDSHNMIFSNIKDLEPDTFNSPFKRKAKMSFKGQFVKIRATETGGALIDIIKRPDLFINWTETTQFDLMMTNDFGEGKDHIEVPYFKK